MHRARINYKRGKFLNLGSYSTPEEAQRVVDAVKLLLKHGVVTADNLKACIGASARLTINGVTKTREEWYDHIQTTRQSIHSAAIKRGWSIDQEIEARVTGKIKKRPSRKGEIQALLAAEGYLSESGHPQDRNSS
jgi:hypothetical protein